MQLVRVDTCLYKVWNHQRRALFTQTPTQTLNRAIGGLPCTSFKLLNNEYSLHSKMQVVLANLDTQFLLYTYIYDMSRYIEKSMNLNLPKQPIIWNEGSTLHHSDWQLYACYMIASYKNIFLLCHQTAIYLCASLKVQAGRVADGRKATTLAANKLSGLVTVHKRCCCGSQSLVDNVANILNPQSKAQLVFFVPDKASLVCPLGKILPTASKNIRTTCSAAKEIRIAQRKLY